MKKVLVVGQGYMGFPLALLLVKAGYKVTGFDIDVDKVNKINSGKMPFVEKDLDSLLSDVNVSFTGNYHASSIIEPADIFIISVPTPKSRNKADMRAVFKAAESICSVVKDGDLVILESTSPPNSTRDLYKNYFKKAAKNIHCAYCPERAFPGNTIHELIYNDRVVGGLDDISTSQAAKVYRSFSKGVVHETTSLNAEVCKLTENAYRDVNIAFANELSSLGKELGFDTREVIALANKHPRVSILNPGPGVGGHCIPIDPLFLVENTKNGNLIRIARKINDRMPEEIVTRITSRFGKKLSPIGLLGLSYKENVDDYRESPAFQVLHLLKSNEYQVLVNDPYIDSIKGMRLNVLPLKEVLTTSKTIIITTGHDQYKKIDFNLYPNIKYIVDTRGVIPSEKISKIHAKVETI